MSDPWLVVWTRICILNTKLVAHHSKKLSRGFPIKQINGLIVFLSRKKLPKEALDAFFLNVISDLQIEQSWETTTNKRKIMKSTNKLISPKIINFTTIYITNLNKRVITDTISVEAVCN